MEGSIGEWSGGVAHSVMVLALVITAGLLLGKLKVKGVSLGWAWIMFAGLAFGHFGIGIDGQLSHFLKELGLLLFVYSICLETGPGFFASFHNGGLRLNMLALTVIALSVAIAIALHFITGTPTAIIAGILSGAVTNTPSLGAAQQSLASVGHEWSSDTAAGYAVAYPMGVIGVIIAFVLLRHVLRINKSDEEIDAERRLGSAKKPVITFTVRIANQMMDGRTVKEMRTVLPLDFIISRICPKDGGGEEQTVAGQTLLHMGDLVLVAAHETDQDAICALLGVKAERAWSQGEGKIIVRRIHITKPSINGKTIERMHIGSSFGASITRVTRAGLDLVATPRLKLLMGDRVTVVGNEAAIKRLEDMLGNSIRNLYAPNLIPIFLGLALGCILGSLSFTIPGVDGTIRLGLAGGAMVVAILIGYFGPKHHLITYNTVGANLMLRELGLCIFLACVGLDAGDTFVRTACTPTGLTWIGYGMLLTMLPILIGGVIGRRWFHINYFALIGVLAGTHTNPPALAYASGTTTCDLPALGYSAVYPFAMFLRIITIQAIVYVFN